MNKYSITVIAILVGLAVGAGTTYWLLDKPGAGTETSGDRQPLYWVAPMDANYRRDKPGKSPMGMDLVPVYEEDAAGGAEAGVVQVSPEVVNSLGVRTGRAETGRLQGQVRTVGYLQYNQDQLIHINPRIAGWIDKLHVTAAGSRVAKGEPLYQLYSPELVNAQQELLLALRQNNQPLIRAAEQRLRAWQIPDDFIARLRDSGKVQQKITYHAPQRGYLATLNVRQGQYVEPGQVLMAIGSLDNIWVEAQVFADQAALMKPGLMVRMTTDYLPGKSWRGTVDYVYPALDPTTRTLPVRVKFANAGGELKPNMFADLTIHNLSEKPATLVPKEAVIRTGQMDRVVLALGDGRFKSVAVTTGRADEQHIEILEGVQPGDSIVTSAQFLLDSESSKTAEFTRMEPRSGKAKSSAKRAKSATAEVVQVQATIHEIMADRRMLNVTHGPIEAWNWPAMTMNFDVAKGVDMAALQPEQQVQLTVEKRGPQQHVITAVDRQSQQQAAADVVQVDATIHEVMPDQRMLNVTHGPIEAWNWPAMTMNFEVAEGVDMAALKPGQEVQLTVEKRGPQQHVITAITAQREPQNATGQGADHQHMDHSHMNHRQMDDPDADQQHSQHMEHEPAREANL